MDEFEVMYPHFDFPRKDALRLEIMMNTMRSRGDDAAEDRYRTLCHEARRNQPMSIQRPVETLHSPELSDGESVLLWIPGSGIPLLAIFHVQITALKRITRWLRLELQAGLDVPDPTLLLQLARYAARSGLGNVPVVTADSADEVIGSLDYSVLAYAVYGTVESPQKQLVWDMWLGQLESWLIKSDSPLRQAAQLQRRTVLYKFQWCRTHILQSQIRELGGFGPKAYGPTKRLVSSSETLLRLMNLPNSGVRPEELQSSDALLQFALLAIRDLEVFFSEPIVNPQSLNDAARHCREALERLEDNLKLKYRVLLCLGRTENERYKRQFTDTSVNEAFDIWEQAETLYRELRLQIVSNNPAVALRAKAQLDRELAKDRDDSIVLWAAILELNKAALAQYKLPGSDNTENIDMSAPTNEQTQYAIDRVIVWSQRGKARALNDVMSATGTVYYNLIRELHLSPAATALLEEAKMLQARLASASFDTKPTLRRAIAAKHEQVDSHGSGARQARELQDAVPIDTTSLKTLLDLLPKNTTIVDYTWNREDRTSYNLTVYQDGAFWWWDLIQRTNLVEEQVPGAAAGPAIKDWMDQWLGSEDATYAPYQPQLSTLSAGPNFCALYDESVESPKEALEVLRPLVAPIASKNCKTKSGNHIILCPTRSLHRLPMHAIPINEQGDPLIERNSVSYVQSLSILRLCQAAYAVALKEMKGKCVNAVVYNGLHQIETENPLAPTCETLRTKVVNENEPLTKPIVLDTITKATLIHFYGHARFQFDAADPLSQHLVLDETLLMNPDPNEAEIAAKTLTGNDIMGLRLTTGCIVLAMGCNSGRARRTEGDNLLGLVSAFFCAGAATVISTLWAIDREDALRFSKIFYTEIAAAMLKGSTEYIDIGLCFQDTVRQCRFDTVMVQENGQMVRREVERKPYHWAGFVLNGMWLMPRMTIG